MGFPITPTLHHSIIPFRFPITLLFAALALLLASTVCALGATNEAPGWNSVPAILARIKAPEFPARDFPITDFGAKADGATDCTDAIAKAVAACHAAGGGRVVVAGGAFLTGAVRLLSNVDLHIAAGATLQFSADRAKFLPVVFTRFEGSECMNYSPLIYAFGQKNIAVTGAGTLDGSGAQTWWGLRAQGAGGVRQDDILTNAGDIATTHVTTDRAANNCGG